MIKTTAKEYRHKISEKAEMHACIELLEQAGFRVFRANTGAAKYTDRTGRDRYVRYNYPGMPDLWGWIPTKPCCPFFWEVKRAGKKLSPAQREFLAYAGNDGCWCGWGTAADLEKRLINDGFLNAN